MHLSLAHLLYSNSPGGAGSMTLRLLAAGGGAVNHTLIVTSLAQEDSINFLNTQLIHCPLQSSWGLSLRPYRLAQKFRQLYGLSFFWRLSRILKRHKIQVLHSNVHGVKGLSQLWACRLSGTAFVWRIGSPSSLYQASWKALTIMPLFYKPGDALVGVSPSVYMAYPQFFKSAQRFIPHGGKGIPNGIEDPCINQECAASNLQRTLAVGQIQNKKANNISNLEGRGTAGEIGQRESVKLITSGRLIPSKRMKDLLDLIKGLAGTHFSSLATPPSFHLTLLGRGPCFTELQQKIEKEGLVSQVHLAGYQSDVLSFLSKADIFVFPTEFESFPNSLLEAMALGLPIVASRVKGNGDLIQNEKNGLLYTCGCIEELVNQVRRLVEDPQWAKNLGQAARQTFLENYSLKNSSELWLKCWESAASSSSGLSSQAGYFCV